MCAHTLRGFDGTVWLGHIRKVDVSTTLSTTVARTIGNLPVAQQGLVALRLLLLSLLPFHLVEAREDDCSHHYDSTEDNS